MEENFYNLRKRYLKLFGDEPVDEGTCDEIERALCVVLPHDLKRIAKFYCGGLLGGISHNAINATGPEDNVVDATLHLRRSLKLDNAFLVIAEPPESLIVLKTASHSAEDTSIIWCSAFDAVRLNTMALKGGYEQWASYRAFFEYLLNLEEEERADVK